jgi:hypothetical protein
MDTDLETIIQNPSIDLSPQTIKAYLQMMLRVSFMFMPYSSSSVPMHDLQPFAVHLGALLAMLTMVTYQTGPGVYSCPSRPSPRCQDQQSTGNCRRRIETCRLWPRKAPVIAVPPPHQSGTPWKKMVKEELWQVSGRDFELWQVSGRGVELWHVRGTQAGRLTMTMHLCQPCTCKHSFTSTCCGHRAHQWTPQGNPADPGPQASCTSSSNL